MKRNRRGVWKKQSTHAEVGFSEELQLERQFRMGLKIQGKAIIPKFQVDNMEVESGEWKAGSGARMDGHESLIEK